MTPDCQGYFGVLRVRSEDNVLGDSAFSQVIGIRNSHNKRLAAGLVSGTSEFVCDNLAFSGEIRVTHKHTSAINAALPALIDSAITKLTPIMQSECERVRKYRDFEIGLFGSAFVDSIIMDMFRNKVIVSSQIGKVWQHWNEPEHDEFKPRTLWSLFNAATSVLKGTNVFTMCNRSQRLYAMCDTLETAASAWPAY